MTLHIELQQLLKTFLRRTLSFIFFFNTLRNNLILFWMFWRLNLFGFTFFLWTVLRVQFVCWKRQFYCWLRFSKRAHTNASLYRGGSLLLPLWFILIFHIFDSSLLIMLYFLAARWVNRCKIAFIVCWSLLFVSSTSWWITWCMWFSFHLTFTTILSLQKKCILLWFRVPILFFFFFWVNLTFAVVWLDYLKDLLSLIWFKLL